MTRRILLTVGCLLALCGVSLAQSLSHNSHPSTPSAASPAVQACGLVYTQSSSQAITPLNSVSCNDGVGHTDNHYWRAFPTAMFPGGLQVCSVDFGIEQATSGSGSQPVTVNIHSHTGAAFPGGTLTLISSANATVPDQAGTIFNVPISGLLPAGADLVVEVFTPDGTATSNLIFIGSNAAPETGPSYISAADCGIPNPTTTSAIGFPNMHIVMNVQGPQAAPVPTLSHTAMAILAALLVAATLVILLRRT